MKYGVVPTSTLPWPLNPFKCKLRDDLYREHPLFADELDSDERQEAFALFRKGRQATDCVSAGCPYQEPLLLGAATLAVELFESGVNCESRYDVEDALPGEPEEWIGTILSFFGSTAIRLTDGQLQNGQHRACGLKVAGVERCVVSTG
ncbi:MAG: hypothetical protein WBQ14_09330 [Gaiellaceae bacterium]